MRAGCGEGECVSKVAPEWLTSGYATTVRGMKSGSFCEFIQYHICKGHSRVELKFSM